MEEQKKNPAQGLSESEQVQVRRQKLTDLQAAGRDPFTLTKFPQDAYSADLKEEFKDLPNETDSGKKVALAGRLMSKRVMGKASFAHLRDDKGDIQLYVRRDELGDDAYAAFKKLDVGDIIGVKGEVFRTKTGELSARAEEITLLTAKGNVGEFTLPDGSRVWLNGESRLKYPAEFSGPTREVALSGEAFFEVSKDSLRPFRVNMDNDINKWLTTGLRASVARTQQTNNVDGSGAIYNALNQLPEVPARNPDGSFGMQTENMYGTYFSNPLSDLIQNENYSRNTQVYVNAFADIKLWKGLVFRTEYAANFNYSNDYKFTPSYDYEHFKQQSSASRGAGNGSNWTLKTYFTYNNTFGKHGLSAMLGHEAQENKYESLSGSRTNFLFNSVHELDAGDATTAKANSSRGSSAIESYFGRLNYNYDDRYLLTATLRADGSSSFAKESRWGWFPSVALAWKVNNEAFLKDVEAINSLKLRLGWGVVGNQWAGSYAYGVTMASAASIWGTGFYAGNYPNRELKWEETNSFNVGLDLALFNNRIEFIADAYYKKTDNLLMQASLPTYVSSLIRAPWVNAGAMTNKGVEFTLNTHNIQTRDFTWTSGLTFSINHNEVTKLYSESSAISGINGSETLTYTMVGEPVGQFYGYKVIGMFKEEGDFYKKGADGNFLLDETGNRIQVAIPKDQTIGKSGIWVGDYIYEDRDNNGVIDEKDRTFLGNPAPKFTFGFNNYLSYKGFDLNIFLNGSVGNKAINLIRRTFTDPMRNSNLLKEATGIAQIAMHDPEVGDEVLSNVYVANADAAKVQRITTSSANDNNRISDRFVEDASYLRIKNISLGYTFPQKWLRRLQIDHLRLYVNIQNLCTITGYKGYDPEIGALNYNVLLRGVDDARYPSQRIYTFGLNFNF